MSAQKKSRAFEQGRVKALRRMKPPMRLESIATPRNHVTRALATRNGGAGRHIRSQGAQRRADRVALQAMVRRGFDRQE